MIPKEKELDQSNAQNTKETHAENMKRIFSLGYYYIQTFRTRVNLMHIAMNYIEILQLLHFIFSSTVNCPNSFIGILPNK